MKVNIVCDDHGWIYDQFIRAFERYSKHIIVRNSNDKCDMTHYIPYYIVPGPKHTNHPCTAWFSHRETKEPLHSKFISAAREVDYAISHSKKYADVLEDNGIKNVIQIMPGVDLDKFKLRPVERKKHDKLIVGYVGRQYSSSSRKNPKLLDRIGRLPNVDLRVTGGKIKEENIPKFYAGLDLSVSCAAIEGGPMAIQESLSVGVPVQCFKDVGVAGEFRWGVFKVKAGDEDEFIRQIELFWDTEHYIDPCRDLDVMQKLRSQVEEQTWKKFVDDHDLTWSKLK